MSVRARTVTLRLKHQWDHKKVRTVTVGAVLTREVHSAPRGEKRLEWMLLTTAPLANFEDAKAVIDGYAQRWKEEFHNLWKSGRCHGRHAAYLRGERIEKWATLLSSVAMRTLQLDASWQQYADDAGADELLTRDEIDGDPAAQARAREGGPCADAEPGRTPDR
ncbi:MAG: hypothetical protein U0326_02855 [Polyangiales bacterium]